VHSLLPGKPSNLEKKLFKQYKTLKLILLGLIYIAFISLGLPDSLLGGSWPVMQPEIGAPKDLAGYVFMVISIGTIISSLFSSRLIKHFGTGRITAFSVVMTAMALLGFHFATSPSWLFVWAIPLGLGAGSIDAGLNEFVAEHYASRHMNWLHSFWGLGAMTGPLLLAGLITEGKSWRDAYLAVAIIQFVLSLILFISLPLWRKVEKQDAVYQQMEQPVQSDSQVKGGIRSALKTKGVLQVLLSVFFYTGIEQTLILWGATYLIASHQINAATASAWISFYLIGITAGRFLSGILTVKFSNQIMIRAGQLLILFGLVLLLLPLPPVFQLTGILLAGLGCAPVFPCILHETPVRFGKENAQEIMGFQMAVAYSGSTLIPPIIGSIGTRTTMFVIPFAALIFSVLMLLVSEQANSIFSERKTAEIHQVF